MRLVITDTGFIWNQNNPFLEKYKDIVLVVCLGGKAVTDKYTCFVSPFINEANVLGMGTYGIKDRKFQRLASVGEKLNAELEYHDDIVFLTDNQPDTLYPFCVVKELNRWNRLHLVAMPPWKIEPSYRRKVYYELLSDLSKLDSILYYDGDKVLEKLDKKTPLSQAYDTIANNLGKLMPCFLNGIYTMHSKPCFFDFDIMKYIPLETGFHKKKWLKINMIDRAVKFPIDKMCCELGIVRQPFYPEDSKDVKEGVERLSARLDGKKVCNMLREQRIKLAKANHISFQSEECPSVGSCAGTCEKCDEESEYLRKQMQNIPEEKRVYPQFDPKEDIL